MIDAIIFKQSKFLILPGIKIKNNFKSFIIIMCTIKPYNFTTYRNVK